MAPGMWPRAHSTSSRVSTRMICSLASRRFFVSRKSSSLMRFFASLTRFRKPLPCSMVSPFDLDWVNRSFHIAPVETGLRFDQKRNAQLVHALHRIFDQPGKPRQIFLGAFEKQFVVDWQDQARVESLGEMQVEFDHGELDEIGRSALHGRVHRGALSESAHILLGG